MKVQFIIDGIIWIYAAVGICCIPFIVWFFYSLFIENNIIKQKPLPIKKVFPDPLLAEYILQEVNKGIGVFKASTDDLITEDDLKHIKKVNLENKGIKNIKGIEKLVNCKEINLAHNQISEKPRPYDLPSNLQVIDLSYNQIKEEWTFNPYVMMDLSFNTGNQKHDPVFYSRITIEDLMQRIGINVSDQDRIWYLYFFNAARLITENKPCFSELGFYKNSKNQLEIKGDEFRKYPPQFYRDDYYRFKSILTGIHQNYQVLKNDEDDPFGSLPENAYINYLTIYRYYANHSYMLGIKLNEVSRDNKDFFEDKNIISESNTLAAKDYRPSKTYTSLQEKLFIMKSLLTEKNHLDPMIALIEQIGDSTEKIDRFIFDHPESKDSLRRYSTYYLPMLSDILDKYIDTTEYKEESRSLKDEVQSALEDTNIAFKKILEILSHIMEIEASCDIIAYRSILEMDGVSGDDFPNKQESDGI